MGLGQGVVLITHGTTQGTIHGRTARNTLRLSSKRACPHCGMGFDELDPRLFSYNAKHGRCEMCGGNGTVSNDPSDTATAAFEIDDPADAIDTRVTCPACQGQRLNPTARAVYFRNHSIADIAALSVTHAAQWVNKLTFRPTEKPIVQDLLPELKSRLTFLEHVGLGYLQLDRSAPTLSGGEAQRIRLAAQLGSNLQGVCYILD
ncbi:MAG: excinuclease ABC subunit A, partial [Gammaproteobacteria bacterium]